MAKIENVAEKRPARMYRVAVSFNGLNVGDTFTQESDDLGWVTPHVESGYVQDLGEVGTHGEWSESDQG